MADLRTIHCEDCGAPRLTRRKNTKYCITCRLLRNFKYLGHELGKCIVCDQPFAPLRRGEEVCGKCDPIPVTGDPRGKCAFCETEDASLVDEDIAVCRGCATSPEKRKLFTAALIKKQTANRNENLA